MKLPVYLRPGVCTLRLVGLIGLMGAWHAAMGVELSREDQRQAARAEIESRYQQAVEDCQGRFAVNACLQEARLIRRQALQPLLDEALAESLAQREQRASQSRERLRQKELEQATLEARRRSDALLAAPPAQPLPAVEPAAAASSVQSPMADVEALRRRDEEAAAARAQAQRQRVQKAEEHRRQVLQRLEERSRRKSLAAPLPPASSASTAR